MLCCAAELRAPLRSIATSASIAPAAAMALCALCESAAKLQSTPAAAAATPLSEGC